MNHIEILKHLISINTTAPPGLNYEATIDYLIPLFKETGLETHKVVIPQEYAEGRDGRVNLICHRKNTEKPRLIIYAHIDVVPAEGWDAFLPKVEKGRIYGRGAADMKGAITALLLGLKACSDQSLNYDLSIMITTDEEVSQASQLQYLKQYLEPVSNAFFCSLDNSFGYVSITGLGLLQMDIKIKGKSVHSGLSHLGDNSVENAGLVITELMELKKKVTSRKSKIDANPETGLLKMEPKLNINVIRGGLKVNIVPDECILSIDRRLIPEENVEEARKEILDVLSSIPNVDWELVKIFSIPPVPPYNEFIVDKLVQIVGDVTGKSGKIGEMGSGDLSHIVTGWGGHEFGLGVIRSGCNVHGKNEFVVLKDIEDLAEIIKRLLVD